MLLIKSALYRRTILYKKDIITIWAKIQFQRTFRSELILSERKGKIIANKISASRTNQKGAMAPNGSANNQSSMQNMGLQRSVRGEHNSHVGEHNHMANRNGQNRNGQNMTNGSVRQQIYKCCFCSSQFVYPNSVITHCEQVSELIVQKLWHHKIIFRNIKICSKLSNWFNAIRGSQIKRPISQQNMDEPIREAVAPTNRNHSLLLRIQ